MDNNRILVSINYGNDLNNMHAGNFNSVPENTKIAIINLKFPSKDGKLGEEFSHRKLLGTKILASIFLDTYSTRVSITTLMNIKEQVNNGESLMFIPSGKDFEDYIWISDKDSVYETPAEFEASIYDFRDKCTDKFEILDETQSIRK